MKSNNLTIQNQKRIWIKEQLKIASAVEIYPDETIQSSKNERFSVVETISDQKESNGITTTSPTGILYGGVDVSFPENDHDPAVAVYTIINSVTFECVYMDYEYFHLSIPYISSFLAFREIEPLQRLINKQRIEKPELTPQVILVDGNGILHTRNAGIACFLGVRTNIPTIGIGKTLFCQGGLRKDIVLNDITKSLKSAVDYIQQCNDDDDDEHEKFVVSREENKRKRTFLFDNQSIQPKVIESNSKESDVKDNVVVECNPDRNSLVSQLTKYNIDGLAIPLQTLSGDSKRHRVLGAALIGHGGRVRLDKPKGIGSTNPIYISIGHKISLHDAVKICVSLSLTRIPEPVRQADLIGRELLRKSGKK